MKSFGGFLRRDPQRRVSLTRRQVVLMSRGDINWNLSSMTRCPDDSTSQDILSGVDKQIISVAHKRLWLDGR